MGHERQGPRGTTTVEFLAPDERLFAGPPSDASEHWTHDRPGFGDDRAPSRWGMGIALVGVAALITAGVIAAEPWSDDEAAAPPTTVPAPNSESADPVTSTAVEGPGPPGSPLPATGGPRSGSGVSVVDRNTPWVVTVPDGFAPVDSFEQPHRSAPGWFELWASPGAARTSGRWFAVQVAQGAKPVLVADAERLAFGDGTLLRWTAADGVQQLQFSPTSGYDVRVTAYGWHPDDLLEIAWSMEVLGGKPLFLVPGPTADQLVVARQSAAFGFEQEYLGGEAWSFAEWRDGSGRRLALTVAPAQRDASTVGRFVVTASTETAMSGPDVRRDVGTLNATVGRLPGFDGQYTAHWTVGDTAYSLTGDLSIDELLDLARTVRPADDVEWGKLQHEVGETTNGSWLHVASGELDNRGSWSMFANVSDGRFSVTIGALQAIIDVPTGVFRTYATQTGRLVVARLDTSTDAAALRVSPDDAPMSVATSQDFLAFGDEVIAAIVVEDHRHHRAEVVDADGRVMFTLTATG